MNQTKQSKRLIFHVDVNSAYLSWTSVERLSRGESDLRDIPACIGGDPEKRHGVVLAKSIAAKKCGVHTGEPLAAAFKKCPKLVVAKPDFLVYQRYSKAFKDICRMYAPAVESFSIDECFLDMTHTQAVYHPMATAVKLKNQIRDTLGFTVNVGVGNNKLLAKTAGGFEKPDKAHHLFRREIPERFWPLPVGDLISVGKSARQALLQRNIRTIGDLAHADERALVAIFGEKMGRHLHLYANGIDNDPVRKSPQAAKGYSISTTVSENVTDRPHAKNVLRALTDAVAERMRADGFQAQCIGVQVRTSDFKNRSRQMMLSQPTDLTVDINRHAETLLSALWDGVTPLRLLGVSLTKLTRERDEQVSMFTALSERDKAKRIDETLDALKQKYGSHIITRGVQKMDQTVAGKKYRAQLKVREESAVKK